MAGQAQADMARGGFFAARWHGQVPLDRVFFFDMLLIATAINLVTSFVSLMAFGFKAPDWVAVAIYLSPLPYNIFLILCIWRATERGGGSASFYRMGALAWLVIATVI